MSTPPTPLPIGDGEIVMRRVQPDELTTDAEDGPTRPSSDAFKQDGTDGETSVYLRSETTAERLVARYPGTYMAEITVGEIRAQGLDVEREDITGDPGHCNIIGRKTRGRLRAMARASRWIPGHAPPEA